MSYRNIVKHYEKCFEEFGDTPKGVDWTRECQVNIRYQVMLELINFRERCFNLSERFSLLDFGCGLSHLYEYIVNNNITYIDYTGLEASQVFHNASINKYPLNNYIYGDLLTDPNIIKSQYDYIVMNGVLTEKINLSYEDMFTYTVSLISKVFNYTKKGLSFNLMSKQVDWEKEYLFHVPMDDISSFLCSHLTRNFVIRNDYGLYEYTIYIYK